MVISIYVLSFWGLRPQASTRTLSLNPAGGLLSPVPVLSPSEKKFWLRPCAGCRRRGAAGVKRAPIEDRIPDTLGQITSIKPHRTLGITAVSLRILYTMLLLLLLEPVRRLCVKLWVASADHYPLQCQLPQLMTR